MLSSSQAFAIASFGIALGNSLFSESLKKVKRSTSFSLYAASQTVAKLDFSPIDSFPDFGLSDGASRDLLGSFLFQVFSFSEFNMKWAIQARLTLFEPAFAGAEESLSRLSCIALTKTSISVPILWTPCRFRVRRLLQCSFRPPAQMTSTFRFLQV